MKIFFIQTIETRDGTTSCTAHWCTPATISVARYTTKMTNMEKFGAAAIINTLIQW